MALEFTAVLRKVPRGCIAVVEALPGANTDCDTSTQLETTAAGAGGGAGNPTDLAPHCRAARRALSEAERPDRMRRRTLQAQILALAVIILLSAADQTAGAQESLAAAPVPGSVVRARASIWKGQRTFEVVEQRAPDSLVLRRRVRSGVEELSISRAAINELLLRERRTRTQGLRLGAAYGSVQGVLSGFVFGALLSGLGYEYYPRGSDQPGVHPARFAIPVGAAIGAVCGGALGAAFPPPVWRRL